MYIGNEAVFRLARELRGVDGDTDPATLRPHVRQWFEAASGKLAEACGPAGEVPETWPEVWAAFLEAWPKVKFPPGTILRDAVQAAEADTRPIPKLDGLEDPAVLLLARTCRALQEHVGDDCFWLSTVAAAKIIERGRQNTHRLLRMFETVGLLEVVKRGNARQATRYRYIGEPTRSGTSTTPLSCSLASKPPETEDYPGGQMRTDDNGRGPKRMDEERRKKKRKEEKKRGSATPENTGTTTDRLAGRRELLRQQAEQLRQESTQ